MSNLFFILAWIISGIGTLLLAGVAVTYIRRTWQLIRAEEDDPTRERILDGLDHIQNQMHLVSQRLGRLEERLEAIEGPRDGEALPAPDRPSDPDGLAGPSDPASRRG